MFTIHLGNVLATLSDRKRGINTTPTATTATHYEAVVLSTTDYYAFGQEMPGRTFSVDGYRFGFNTQEKTSEVHADHYTAQFWEYDSRIGRRWNLDPKGRASVSDFSVLGNNPIWNNDVLGDTIKNKVSFDVALATEEREVGLAKYYRLMSMHQGEISKRARRKYERQSGLNEAEEKLKIWREREAVINSMITTFEIVMPSEFNYLNSLPINISINYSPDMGKGGEYNPMSVAIPTETKSTLAYGSTQNITVWTGNFLSNTDIKIFLYGGGTLNPFNTKYLANEFGDIDYFFKHVIPNDPASYLQWKTTGNSKFSGYYNDPSGAGQMSFSYQYKFEAQFKIVSKNFASDKVDKIKFIIHK